jgi:hypothetical protein
MTRWMKAITAAVAALALTASTARAQNANIQALANVFAAITVTAGNDLDFGSVFPGVPKTVATSDASAGTFSATGEANAAVNLTFTLPANLTSGGNNLPINAWSGCYDSDNVHAGCTAFVPSGVATSAGFSGIGQLFVWIGATVNPAANQAAGAYAATITLQLDYF